MDIYKELVELLLPEDLLKNFELIDLKKEGIHLRIYLEERKTPPEGYSNQTIRTNGFTEEIEIQDFPLRDKLVTLHVKKRRWLLVEENKADNTFQYENGDSKRQLLAISRYLLFKISSKWTISQRIRANLLFKEYPKIEKAYKIAMELMSIYENTILKGVAYTKMAQWFNKIERSNLSAFKTIKKKRFISIMNQY